MKKVGVLIVVIIIVVIFGGFFLWKTLFSVPFTTSPKPSATNSNPTLTPSSLGDNNDNLDAALHDLDAL